MQINNLTNFNQKSSGVTLPTNLEGRSNLFKRIRSAKYTYHRI